MGDIRHAYTYDKMHRMLTETQPGLNTVSYVYDAAGNLVSGGRRPAALTYDALNRVIVRAGGDTSTFSYDEIGNLRTAANANGRTARRYGRNGTLVADTQWVANRRANEGVFSHVYGLAYGYDLNLRRTSLTHPGSIRPTATPQTYEYSPLAGFLTATVDVFGARIGMDYDNDQRMTRLVRGRGAADSVVETRGYDLLSRMVRRRHTLGAQVLHNDSLTYDRRNKILQNVLVGDTLIYTALGTLVRSSGTRGTEVYTTDALGLRRTGSGWLAGGGRQATYLYTAGSERLDYSTRVVMGGVADTTYYTRDVHGALLEETTARRIQLGPTNYRETQRTTHFYDAERRLNRTAYRVDTVPSQVFFPGNPIPHQTQPYNRVERMRYDPLGRRVWREMIRDTLNQVCFWHDRSSGCRNEVNRTVYDGDQVLYDIRTQADTVGEGSESEGNGTAFTGVVGYTHAGGIDAPLGLFKGTDRVWTLTDWRGQYDLGVCGSALCNSSYFFPGGSSTAYGEIATFPNGPPSWYGELITGMADGSGLQYRRHRYYDPGSGQFTQEDPIGLAGGLNLYGYANGDPVNFSDPFGLCPFFLTGRPCSTGTAIGVGLVPIAGDAIDIVGALMGTDLLTGESITGAMVGVSIAGTIAGSGKLAREVAKPSIGAIKGALEEVHAAVGKLPKGSPGKFGSPQRGTSKVGYRLDPPHPKAKPGTPEEGWHINWWDYSEGKRGRGGRSDAVRIPQ